VFAALITSVFNAPTSIGLFTVISWTAAAGDKASTAKGKATDALSSRFRRVPTFDISDDIMKTPDIVIPRVLEP
jgi:hypothetical protein